MNAASRFHPEVLPPAQQDALRVLAPAASAQGFYLGGGTALAIQLGHRRSYDFDWFREPRIQDPLALALHLRAAGVPFHALQVVEDTLHGATAGIASMKLSAVAQRGARKDFVDLYALGCNGMSLLQMLEEYMARFGIADVAHVLVALSYFEDAEREPMPERLWHMDSAAIKSEIQAWVKAYAG